MTQSHVLIDGVWVDMAYEATELKHSTGWVVDEKSAPGGSEPSPSGDLRASVTLKCDPEMQASWMDGGKSFRIISHGLEWGGVTANDVDRNEDGITIHATGIGDTLKDWDAIYDADPTGGVDEQATFDPNDAVDYAELTGAPFHRNGVDLSPAVGSDPISDSGPATNILTLLSRAAFTHGKRVHVDSWGAITYVSDPTTPTWMMTPQPDYFATSDDTYLSLLRGFYLERYATVIRVQVTGGATSGTFTLSGNGNTTSSIAYNASAATMQTRVQSLGGPFSAAVVTLLATSDWSVDVGASGVTLSLANNSLGGGTNPGVSIKADSKRSSVTAEDEAAAEKFRIKQGRISLEGLGPIPEATAQAYVDGRFLLVGARMGWTTQLELRSDNLFHITGVWGSARCPRAGEMLQIPGIIDARSNPTTRGSIQWVMQEVEITEGADPTALVTPVGFVPRDFSGALNPPENPADREAA